MREKKTDYQKNFDSTIIEARDREKMVTREKTKQKTGQSLKVVERAVRAPAKADRKLENFKKLLVLNLLPKAKVENVVQTIVDSALVCEYTPKIRQRTYYNHMSTTISNALLKNKALKQDAMSIAKHYQKLLG